MSRIRDQIKFHEGVKNEVYKDHLGYLTVGVGHLILESDPENDLDVGDTISDERVNELFEIDLKSCTDELDAKLPWWKDCDDVRQRCLIDLVFNMGMPRLLKFKKTLELFENGDYENAGIELLDSNYARQVPNRANRISEMIKTGIDSQDF